MAVPGETRCRAVAPCAPGTFGDIPVEATNEYVDASYPGTDSDGSAAKPWTTIDDGIAAAAPNAIVAIAEGSYLEDVAVGGKPVRLWGVCPERVEVVGSGAVLGAVRVLSDASGTELRDLAIRGNFVGLVVSGSTEVLVDRVWIHDNADRGINVQGDLGATSFTVRGSLVESNTGIGVFVAGADGALESSVVRRTNPDAQGGGGRGVGAQAHMGQPPTSLSIAGSLIEQNQEMGVFIQGSTATIDATVVRTTQTDTQGIFGRGFSVQPDPRTGAPSSLVLDTSVVDENAEAGVYVQDSAATISSSVVRSTQPNAEGLEGRGVNLQSNLVGGEPAALTLTTSLIDQNHSVGLFLYRSDANVDRSVIRRTLGDAEGPGRGVNVQPDDTGAPSHLELHTSLLADNDSGVFIIGSEATVDASVLRAEVASGRGVNVQHDQTTGVSSTLTLQSSIIEASVTAGVAVISSAATIDGCVIRQTIADENGNYGDGVLLSSVVTQSSATITSTRIEESARAAVGAFGVRLMLGGSRLSCHAFDLDREAYMGFLAELEDLGGNRCGCPDANASCKAVGASLSPPPPLETLE
jgi:hypothetical protein